MARKPDKNKKNPKVNSELEGFDLRVDSFGEIKSNLSIDKLNEFLNKNVDDKKLRDRNDLTMQEQEEEKPKKKKNPRSEDGDDEEEKNT